MEERRQQRAVAIGADRVVEIWETMNDGYPFYAVFYNLRNKYFQFNKNDYQAAKSFLTSSLDALQQSGDNAMYYLNIYDESQKNYPNAGMVCSFPFRLNEFSSVGAGPGGNVDALAKLIKEQHEKQLELMAQIAELQQKPDTWDRIGALLETPGLAQSIVPLVQPIIGSLMGIVSKISGVNMSQPVNGMPSPMIAGPQSEVDPETALDSALDRLEKHGDLVEMLTTLADFADKNPDQFKMYFKMLKG